MALAGIEHTGTPGGASGTPADIRATLAGDSGFTTSWTVHPLVTFNASTVDEFGCFVCEHVNGHQVLFLVAYGNQCSGNDMIVSGRASGVFSAITDLTIWVALDPNGGGVASNSFYDNLNNNGLNPASAGFWNQSQASQCVRLNEWYESGASTRLWFVYDTTAGHLLLFSNSEAAGRVGSIGSIVISDALIVDSRRPVAERMDSKAGVLACEPDTDAGGNDTIGMALYVFPRTDINHHEIENTSNIIDGFWIMSSWEPLEPNPTENLYLTQTFPVKINPNSTDTDDGTTIVGEVDRNLFRLTSNSDLPLGVRRNNGALIYGPGQTLWAWDQALGDMFPTTISSTQTIEVPAGATSMTVELWGAGGGGAYSGGLGGGGAYVKGDYAVTPGQMIDFVVGTGGGDGGLGGSAAAGTPGGGAGNVLSSYRGGGGGGYTAVKLASTYYFVAAGGGGAGTSDQSPRSHGGAGGITLGEDGGDIAGDADPTGGKGATDVAGGAAGTDATGNNGFAGSSLQGGDAYLATNAADGAGGGGGGWYGGGGGANNGSDGAGGGGGSSYVDGSATNVTTIAGSGQTPGGTPPANVGAGGGTDSPGQNGAIILIWNF